MRAKGITRPACADFNHIRMAVEMHTIARLRALAAGKNVPTRVFVAVTRRALRPDHLCLKAVAFQAVVQIFADQAIIFARRVQRRDADQILRQGDQVIAFRGNCVRQGCIHALIVERLRSIGKSDCTALRMNAALGSGSGSLRLICHIFHR